MMGMDNILLHFDNSQRMTAGTYRALSQLGLEQLGLLQLIAVGHRLQQLLPRGLRRPKEDGLALHAHVHLPRRLPHTGGPRPAAPGTLQQSGGLVAGLLLLPLAS